MDKADSAGSDSPDRRPRPWTRADLARRARDLSIREVRFTDEELDGMAEQIVADLVGERCPSSPAKGDKAGGDRG